MEGLQFRQAATGGSFPLVNSQRRTKELHPVVGKQLGQFRPRRNARKLRSLGEERLHLPCGLESDEHPTDAFPKVSPYMGYASGRQDRIPGTEIDTRIPDLDRVLPLDHVEPFILVRMHVSRWPAPAIVHLLENQETAVGVARADLQVDGEETKNLSPFAEAIAPRRYGHTTPPSA
jgi:hypothetical protein